MAGTVGSVTASPIFGQGQCHRDVQFAHHRRVRIGPGREQIRSHRLVGQLWGATAVGLGKGRGKQLKAEEQTDEY